VPVGRPPKPIDADASLAAAFGAEIRARRTTRGWTLQVLSDQIGYTPQHISDAELAKAPVSEHFAAAVDRALDADGRLRALLPAVVIERAFERQKRATARRAAATLDDDVKRRAFLGLGLAVVLLGPDAAARARAEDWDRIAHQWMCEVGDAPDRQVLLPGLAADLRRLAQAGGPQRVVAQLSTCVAMIALSGGDPATARRWWSRAQVAARAAGDPHLAAYVGGQHAYEGVYALYSPARALALADDALAVTDAPCVGRMHALSARARALALLGRKRQARDALNDVEKTFSRLPPGVTRHAQIGGWSEDRLHHAASFVAAFGGVGTAAAHDEALRANDGLWRCATQIELHRAVGEVDASHALDTFTSLSEAQRSDQFIRRLAARALASCEARGGAGGAGAAELREALSAA
jgi:transcriptional regulator with XRE-family HTH domain